MVDSNSVLVNVFYKYYVNPSDSGGILVGESVLPRSLRSRGLDFPASQAPAKRPPIPKRTACLTSKKDKALSCLVPVRSNTRVARQAGKVAFSSLPKLCCALKDLVWKLQLAPAVNTNNLFWETQLYNGRLKRGESPKILKRLHQPFEETFCLEELLVPVLK